MTEAIKCNIIQNIQSPSIVFNKHKISLSFSDNSFVHWIAKLFKEKATWGEAKDKCHKNNGELLLIPENEVRIDIGIIAGTREWFFNM